MTEYNRMAKGSYTVSGGTLGSVAPNAQVINLPFQPDYVEFLNYTEAATPAEYGVPQAWWDKKMGQGFAMMDVFYSSTNLTTDVVTSGGISTFSAGQLLGFGPRHQVVASTKATSSFQVTAHGFSVGDVVVFEGLYQSSTTGMPQICGMPFVVTTVTDANNFIINWNLNQSAYTALSASPTGAYVKKVLYPYLYAPGVAFVSAVSTGSTTTVTTTAPNNFVVGQEIAFRIPPAYGMTQLNSLPNAAIPGSPIYGYVVSVTNSTQFVCNINSTGFTALNTNQPVASVPGLQFPQVLAVGDVNTGGVLYSGSQLYPPPVVNSFNTINGPAIQGAFVNNTSQGFIIGAGAGATITSAFLGGVSGDVVYWRAYLFDYVSP